MYHFSGLDHLVDDRGDRFLRAFFTPQPFEPFISKYFVVDLRGSALHLRIQRGLTTLFTRTIPFPSPDRAHRAFYRLLGRRFRDVPTRFPAVRALPTFVPLVVSYETFYRGPSTPVHVFLVPREHWPFFEGNDVPCWAVSTVGKPVHAVNLHRFTLSISIHDHVIPTDGQLLGRMVITPQMMKEISRLIFTDPLFLLTQIALS